MIAAIQLQPPVEPKFLGELAVGDRLGVVMEYYRAYCEYVLVQGRGLGDGASDASSDVQSVSTAASELSVNSSASSGRAARRARARAAGRSRAAQLRLSVEQSATTVGGNKVEVDGMCDDIGVMSKGDLLGKGVGPADGVTGVDTCSAASPVAACYTKVLVDPTLFGDRATVTFRELLALPESALLSRDVLRRVRVCRVAEGMYHAGDKGESALRCFGVISARAAFAEGTFGRELQGDNWGKDDNAPALDDMLGMPGDAGGVTRLVAMCRLDAESFGAVADLCKRPGEKVGVVLPDATSVVGALSVRNVPLSDLSAFSQSTQARLLRGDVFVKLGTVMACDLRGLSVLLAHNSDSFGELSVDRTELAAATKYLVQHQLLAAGAPPGTFVLVEGAPEGLVKCLPAESSVQPNPFMSISGEAVWDHYVGISDLAVNELLAGCARRNVSVCMQFCSDVVRSLSNGVVVVPTISWDDALSCSSGAMSVLGRSVFTDWYKFPPLRQYAMDETVKERVCVAVGERVSIVLRPGLVGTSSTWVLGPLARRQASAGFVIEANRGVEAENVLICD